uniref:Uncharacterized protein n=1 Tax=Meloidogyne enterolobii TaxID=390850 RepID=A0A6V7UR55_MELEN|nr:unnamed protein product [Meloidogyne enterolobii]
MLAQTKEIIEFWATVSVQCSSFPLFLFVSNNILSTFVVLIVDCYLYYVILKQQSWVVIPTSDVFSPFRKKF